jgi:hypothetical protein
MNAPVASETDFNAIADHPIFVIGHPRSGTSLMRGLLDGHPQLVTFSNELQFFQRLDQGLTAELVLRSELNRLFNGSVFSVEGVTREQVEAALNDALQNARSNRDKLLAIIKVFAQFDPARGPGKLHWVEKTPGNTFFVPLLSHWFPDARFIYMVRDPVDVLRSMRRIGTRLPFIDFLVHYASYVARLDVAVKHLKGKLIMVRYEDLVRSPDTHLPQIAGFLGIDFNPSLLASTMHGKAEHRKETGLSAAIHAESIGKRDELLDELEAAQVASYLNHERALLGYSTEGVKPLTPPIQLIWARIKAATRARSEWVIPQLCYIHRNAAKARFVRLRKSVCKV